MAGDAMKNRIAKNKAIFKVWLIISVVFTAISAFMIFYVKRNTPEKQNKITFYVSTGVIVAMLAMIKASIRVTFNKQTKKVETKGDLSAKGQHKLDIIGVSIIVQFVGIWWEQASYIYFIIPAYAVYSGIKFVFSLL